MAKLNSITTPYYHKVYIALGSNLGDRMQHINTACGMLEQQLGFIKKLASIYTSKAVGFKGDSFLNTCVLIHTNKTPSECLAILQGIEIEIGRLKNTTGQYENRPIDLDLIFHDSSIVKEDKLIVPHPQVQDRDFVLKPLVEINPDLIHPVLNKTVSELDHSNHSQSSITSSQLATYTPYLIDYKNKHTAINALQFLAIEGNIGSGKTSLTEKLAADFNAKKVLERFADNPFLPIFYKEPDRYSFPLEMSFLADRYQQLTDDVVQQDLFSSFSVADYYVVKSLIFSEITLQDEEFILYKRLFNMMYKELLKPDLYIYLYQTEDRLLENIRSRGRDYEKHIEAQYLQQIQKGYSDFIKAQQLLHVKVIDVSQLDFVNNQQDYIFILETIAAAIS